MSELKKAIDFQRTMSIPDLGERTNNDPCYLMSSNDVLKLIKSIYPDGTVTLEQTGKNSCTFLKYGNLSHANSGKEVIVKHMVAEIIEEATNRLGWSEVKLIGKQLLFIK